MNHGPLPYQGCFSDQRHLLQPRSAGLPDCPRLTVMAPGGPPDRARGGHDPQIRRFLYLHPALFRSVRDVGLVSLGCPDRSGAPEGCSSAWLPAWLPGRATARVLPVVFKSVRGLRPAGTATCVVGIGCPARQDHPAYTPRILRPAGPLPRCPRAGKLAIGDRCAAGCAGGDDHNLIAAAVWPPHGTCAILVGVAR